MSTDSSTEAGLLTGPPDLASPILAIHLTRSVAPSSYGLGQVALNLSREQTELGIVSSIWTLDGSDAAGKAAAGAGLALESVRGFAQARPGFLGFSREMERAARGFHWQGNVVVHQHMIWQLYSRIPRLLLKASAARVVIAPHGSLDDWALRKSSAKKALAKWLYEGQNLHSADCLHATSEREVGNFRDFGLRNPIALINNGVSPALLQSQGDAEAFRSRFGLGADQHIMLFISRIARKKGLPMLLDAMNHLRHRLQDWVLVIAGVDEEGHESEVALRVRELGLEGLVKFVGPLFDQAKRDAFEAAEIFVLPSHSEGSPMIVLEAMAAGVPVLTTKASPWEELVRHGCGWWCEISVAGLCEALEDVVSLSGARRRDMGARAKALVARDYTWRESARKTLELYAWLYGEGARPPFILMDSR